MMRKTRMVWTILWISLLIAETAFGQDAPGSSFLERLREAIFDEYGPPLIVIIGAIIGIAAMMERLSLRWVFGFVIGVIVFFGVEGFINWIRE